MIVLRLVSVLLESSSHISQVPPVTFTFLDINSKKGLNEDAAFPAILLHVRCIYLVQKLRSEFMILMMARPLVNFVLAAGQIQTETNTKFAMSWLPSFALDPPTEKEVKDIAVDTMCIHA